MEEKIREMETLAAKLGLTQQDLENWIVSRLAQEECTDLRMPLPLVYKHDNELYLSLGLERENNDEVFGWVLSSGVIMRRIYPIEAGNSLDWSGTRRYVESLVYDGQLGMMVDKQLMQASWTSEEKLKVHQTMRLLELNGISCGKFNAAICWCAEEVSSACAVDFVFAENRTAFGDKNLSAEVVVLKF